MIFNNRFEYDVIQTSVRAQNELVYFLCSRTRSPRLKDVLTVKTVETAVIPGLYFDCIC